MTHTLQDLSLRLKPQLLVTDQRRALTALGMHTASLQFVIHP